MGLGERALIAEAEAELRRDYPSAGEAEAGLIGEAAIAYLHFSRTITADFREADRRAILRWRKALRTITCGAAQPQPFSSPPIYHVKPKRRTFAVGSSSVTLLAKLSEATASSEAYQVA